MLSGDNAVATMKAMAMVGVPYIEADYATAADEVSGKTELDAVVAYLQVLGTMVTFEEGVDYRE